MRIVFFILALVAYIDAGYAQTSVSVKPAAFALARTIVVSPVLGDTGASGHVLTAAVSGIADATAENPVLVKVEPGTFLLPKSLVLKRWVRLEGSGKDITILKKGYGVSSRTAAVVRMVSNSQIGDLTIENFGGGNPSVSVGLLVDDASISVLIEDIVARANDASTLNIGISVQEKDSEVVVRNVRTENIGGDAQSFIGFGCSGASNVRIEDAILRVSGAAAPGMTSIGIRISNNCSAKMFRVDSMVTMGGGDQATGIDANGSKRVDIYDSISEGHGAHHSRGLILNSGDVHRTIASASGGVTVTEAIWAISGINNISHSHLSSTDSGLVARPLATLNVVSSQVSGTRGNRGIYNCLYSYDQNLVPLSDVCL